MRSSSFLEGDLFGALSAVVAASLGFVEVS